MASKIQNNNTSLEQILATINALPEEGSGGVELPELSNPGVADDLVVGKQLIDGDGGVVTGTNPYEKTSTDAEVNEQTDLLQQITTTLAGKTAVTPVLQSKTVSPSTSQQNVTPDSGYDGLSKVTVNAMPTATQATPSISVSDGGLITASATQSAGYVAAGTKSATKQLTTQAAQTITPGASNKTIASGRYLTGTQTIKGDANLVAGNIKSGISIFGVAGNYEGSSGSGGIEMTEGTFEYSSEMSSPLAYNYTLRSDNLLSSTRNVILILVKERRNTGGIGNPIQVMLHTIIYRKDKNSSFNIIPTNVQGTVISAAYGVEISENEIVLYEVNDNSSNDNYLLSFEFMAI